VGGTPKKETQQTDSSEDELEAEEGRKRLENSGSPVCCGLSPQKGLSSEYLTGWGGGRSLFTSWIEGRGEEGF